MIKADKRKADVRRVRFEPEPEQESSANGRSGMKRHKGSATHRRRPVDRMALAAAAVRAWITEHGPDLTATPAEWKALRALLLEGARACIRVHREFRS